MTNYVLDEHDLSALFDSSISPIFFSCCPSPTIRNPHIPGPMHQEKRAEIRHEESGRAMWGVIDRAALSDRLIKFFNRYPDGLKSDYARFFVVSRFTFPIGVIGHAGFFFIFWYLDLTVLAVFNIFSVALFAYASAQNRRGNMRLPAMLAMVGEIPVHAILATIYIGPATGFWLYFFLSTIWVLLVPFYSRRLRLSLSAVLILALVVLASFALGAEPIRPIAGAWVLFLFINNVLTFAAVMVALVSSYEFAVVRAEDALQQEFDRAETLLLNILPADIAARLKASEKPLADSHESVSVLFADLVGFTAISRTVSATQLVNLLNDLFSRFDRLADEHGAEKIKTIGDSYMVATGLSPNVTDHAEKIAELALDMRRVFGEFRRDNHVDLKIRIGIHSGAIISGVIGNKKFAYDLWGDTVNIASRMESEGLVDKIQISAETCKMLSGRYQISPRGEIQIKGHRPRETYLLEGHA